MQDREIKKLVENQRSFYLSEATRSYDFRIHSLEKLKAAILKHEKNICEALALDLGKTEFEAYMTEIGMVLDDLGHAIKHLKKWMKIKKVRTPLAQFKSKSFVYPEPYGVTLIMAPWNYPFMLCIEPLTASLAAGNTAVLKPASYSANVSKAIANMIKDTFDEKYVCVVEGGREENAALLEQKYDYIFFTGSPTFGRVVMQKASVNLTPVSLELGGKSPVIVDKSANLKLAAKRVAFGKYLNAGQTCVAPDYVLVDKSVKEEFAKLVVHFIKEFFPNGDYSKMPKIINNKRYTRLLELINKDKLYFGGKSDEKSRWIEPTVLLNVEKTDLIMQEEIFGPIMPILEYEKLDEAINFIVSGNKPLALYLFTQDKEVENKVLQSCSYGGGCINDTIIHLATNYMPFGGVGESGMGSYHGKQSFDTFTHYKSIVKKATWIDLDIRYQPYTDKKLKLLKMFLK